MVLVGLLRVLNPLFRRRGARPGRVWTRLGGRCPGSQAALWNKVCFGVHVCVVKGGWGFWPDNWQRSGLRLLIDTCHQALWRTTHPVCPCIVWPAFTGSFLRKREEI